MTGTARVQNNRTMMLASVSSDIESHGRRGIAFLGGLPFIGRLFTSPTRDVKTIDIVIAVTPRVLRAPTVTPRDEEMRPSGTLQSPTTGSLAEMVREADRDDQIAAARVIPRNAAIQLPDAAPVVVAPKPTDATLASNTSVQVPASGVPAPKQVATVSTESKTAEQVEDLPAYVPAPKSLVSEKAASEVAAVNASTAGTQNAALASLPKAQPTSFNTASGTRIAQLSFLPEGEVLKIGEKRRYLIQLTSDVSLSLALMALRFDPKVVKLTAVTAGSMLSGQPDPQSTTFAHSVDANGVCLISISALNGKSSIQGTGSLVVIDLEAIGAGEAALVFDKDTLHLVGTDARDVVTQVSLGRATVKQ
jgi:general secretion pathway protein D